VDPVIVTHFLQAYFCITDGVPFILGWGYAGTYFFMDTTTGIAVVMGTQLLPRADPDVLNLWKELEKALYSGLIVA